MVYPYFRIEAQGIKVGKGFGNGTYGDIAVRDSNVRHKPLFFIRKRTLTRLGQQLVHQRVPLIPCGVRHNVGENRSFSKSPESRNM